jgi:chorismate mutase
MAALRAEIDGLDQQLLDVIAQRLRVADRLTALKQDNEGLPIRPGREVQLLRRLVESAPQPMEPELVVEIWRALIAANLRRQRKFDVVVGGGRGDPTRLFDVARRHFGARARITHVGEQQTALLKAAEQPESVVAVTTWPAAPGVGSWWPALTEQRFRNLHLIAGLPMRGPIGEEPEAAVFAATTPEPAGEDVSLLIAFDPHHKAQRVLSDAGFHGKELARSEPRVLLRVEGYVRGDDPRAAGLSGNGLEGVRVLGSYARV